MITERYIDLFCSMLKNTQLKCTAIRQDILRVFFQNTHLSVEDILRNVNTSKQTVYATLKLLLSFNIISQDCINGKPFYELTRGQNHLHFLCTKCKKFIDFKDETLSNLIYELSSKHQFSPNKLDMTIYGICSICNPDNKYQ